MIPCLALWRRGRDAGRGRAVRGAFQLRRSEARVGKDHPLRAIRGIVNEALSALSGEFAALYAPRGRPSIPPEKLLRAMLLRAFYSSLRDVRPHSKAAAAGRIPRWRTRCDWSNSTGLRLSGVGADSARLDNVFGAKAHVVYDPDQGCPVYHAVRGAIRSHAASVKTKRSITPKTACPKSALDLICP